MCLNLDLGMLGLWCAEVELDPQLRVAGGGSGKAEGVLGMWDQTRRERGKTAPKCMRMYEYK